MTTHRTNLFTPASLVELNACQTRPCLSLYQPTHRSHPDNLQDPIRFGELIKTLEASLQQQPTQMIKALIAPLEDLAQDHDFWMHTLDGLAVLSAPDFFRIFLLPRPVLELGVVADSFHTKPLRRFLQSIDRYQVLAVSLHKVQLFEGNRNSLEVVDLSTDVPQSMTALEIDLHHKPHSTVSPKVDLKNETDKDTERFFRAVDRAVLECYSHPSGLPLMLAALPEHHHLFHAVSHNPFLMPHGLMINPQSLTHSQLQLRAWEVANAYQQAQQTSWSDSYAIEKAKGMGSESLPDVAHAAVAGRVATLLIEAGRQDAGRIDISTGRIDFAPLGSSRVDDVLDDLGALVEKMGGQVHVMPADRMPTRTGVAATFRH